MSVYLDASVLVALFVEDPLSQLAHDAVSGLADTLVVSDYASLEFSASIQRFVRAKMLSAKHGRAALLEFDAWVATGSERAETVRFDIVGAKALVRKEGIALRSADAVHVAIAQRIGARLLTFDKKLASNARRLGLTIA